MSVESKRTFFCPYCQEKLSFIGGTIIKLEGVLRGDRFSVRAMFYFSAKLGDYGCEILGPVEVEEGARVEYHCINPECDRDLTASYSPELAELRMEDDSGRSYVVVFNKIYGRQATFLVDPDEKKLVEHFGEHAEVYADTFDRPLNYFGAI
jgi:hypothetical protein